MYVALDWVFLWVGDYIHPGFSPYHTAAFFSVPEEGLPKLLRRGIDFVRNGVDRTLEVTLENPIDNDRHPGDDPADEDPLQHLNTTLILEVRKPIL